MKSILLYFICFCSIPVLHAQSATPKEAANLIFWKTLQGYCGQAFEGTVLAAPETDTTFKNKKLLMHVRSCEGGRIRIPFFVGDDRSRTWVLTLHDSLLQLKHDHRHVDGSEDKVTQYGGMATNTGISTTQFFPADQYTVNMLPAAAANVWWIDLVPSEHFTYHLRRIGSSRQFSIRFDLKKPVDIPAAPWGWKDE